jgi:hypothetical protein
MVAKITTPLSINRALNYNEHKVQKGKAQCLFAGNFLHRADELNFYQKLDRFQKLIEQNTSKTNTLHVSLNFHPTENLSKQKFIEIAEAYMDKIGFGEQPFLVYQHFDAGHPHLHIVTTNIRENGKRIDTYNIGKVQSQKAREEIEVAYGLMKASGRKSNLKENAEPLNVQRVKYGLTETKRSITNVLNAVLKEYKFTSLAELNAVLKLYNVAADRGTEGSRIYRNHGLTYRLLDEKGNKIGVPVKASAIYCKPTLNYLEEKFALNESLRQPFASRTRTAIDWALSKRPTTHTEFIRGLQKENVTAVVRENEQKFMYGITFIDHRTKSVFNGSDLGKRYSAKSIKEAITNNQDEAQKPAANLLSRKGHSSQSQKNTNQLNDKMLDKNSSEKTPIGDNLWELLMNKERSEQRIPFDFIRKKKKRRKPKL